VQELNSILHQSSGMMIPDGTAAVGILPERILKQRADVGLSGIF